MAKPGELDRCLFIDVSLHLGAVHVLGVIEILGKATVLEDDGMVDVLDHHVGVFRSPVQMRQCWSSNSTARAMA